MSFRSQYVKIGTKRSSIKSVTCGVLQGSVLGPILLIAYVNKMPETVRRLDCRNQVHMDTEYLFGKNCLKCGTITCYTDDSNYAVSSRDRESNQVKINENMDNIKIFWQANKLCINESKTCLLETMNKQKRCKTHGSPPSIMVLNDDDVLEEKNADLHCRLLGRKLSQGSHMEISSGLRGKTTVSVPQETVVCTEISQQKHPHAKPENTSRRSCLVQTEVFAPIMGWDCK